MNEKNITTTMAEQAVRDRLELTPLQSSAEVRADLVDGLLARLSRIDEDLAAAKDEDRDSHKVNRLECDHINTLNDLEVTVHRGEAYERDDQNRKKDLKDWNHLQEERAASISRHKAVQEVAEFDLKLMTKRDQWLDQAMMTMAEERKTLSFKCDAMHEVRKAAIAIQCYAATKV